MLEVAVGHSDDPDSEAAIAEIIEQCSKTLSGSIPKAGLLFAAIDFDYPLILQKIQDKYPGIDRICDIVRSLRTFSRLDEAEVKAIDIHESIDSTLMILQNQVKARPEHPGIQILQEYGSLPMVECYAGQINQVFMNILANAIDVLEERDRRRSFAEIKASPSVITIRTQPSHPGAIAIHILDNGSGMNEITTSRLFDPFFTTKDVGKGTGLGMSISYDIVTRHKGSLRCISALGAGSEFIIEIPIKQEAIEISPRSHPQIIPQTLASEPPISSEKYCAPSAQC